MPAPLPTDEEDRLKELVSYGILDSPAELAFDRITVLAARIFRVPMAFITLIDRERQWLKSCYGFAGHDTDRGDAFCAHTVLAGATVIVPDATLDERFRDNIYVTGEPHVRFYAGAPLTTPRGHTLGSLCVVDTRPREFSPDDRRTLEDLAALVMHELHLRLTSERSLAELEMRKRVDVNLRATRDDLEARIQQRTTALVEAEARYRSLFENAAEGIYQFKPGEGFLSVNPAFANIFGYASPETMIQAVRDPVQLYARPAERDKFEALLARDSRVANLEMEARRTDGSRVWILENARVVRDAGGNALRHEGTVVDITARHIAEEALQHAHEELEDRVHERTAELALLNGDLRQQNAERQHAEENARRSESKFRALLENAQDLTSLATPEGVVMYTSPSIQHILGYGADELVGKNLFDNLVHPEDDVRMRAHLRHVSDAGEHYVHSEARLRHRDGTWRLLESISSPLPPDFPVVGQVINSRDITERRRNEQEVEARARQQAAAAELGRQALREGDLAAYFERTVELVAQVLDVNRASIGELQPGGATMLIRAGHGFPAGIVGRATVENWHWQLLDGAPDDHHPLFVSDLREVLDYSARPEIGQAAVSAISAVIHDSVRPYGTLCALSTRPRKFTPGEQVFLQTVADLLSTVIESRHHQARLREVEARYRRIVANTPGMVYQLVRHAGGEFALPFVSEGCRQLFEIEPAQAIAQPTLLRDAVHPEDLASVREAIRVSVETSSPVSWEGRLRPASGILHHIAVRMQPERQPNGDIIWDGVIFDVSELKRAETAMRAAKDEAERANSAKSEFLSRMSHELRTPLNAILGFGQLLGLETLTPMQASSVDQILTGGRHLLDLVNEVLDIARIEAGKVDMAAEPLAVDESIAATLRFVQPMAQQHCVRLVHRALPRPDTLLALADPGRFNQVLLNLLSNAIKYNHPDGAVRVSARRRGGRRWVRVTISDTGPGLSPVDISRLFTPFQRLKAPERGITGTGIGLAISKGLVEAMGGTVGVRSTVGQGCRFYIDLPLAADVPPPVVPAGERSPWVPLAAAAPPEPPPVRTVLLIDDQPANVALVERVFQTRDDLRLFAAVDGRDGLAQARERRPDLILLDLHLPDIQGDEVVRRLHTERRTTDIPVLVLSADATPGQIDRLRGLGVRDYLTKPFKIDTLLRAIDGALAVEK